MTLVCRSLTQKLMDRDASLAILMGLVMRVSNVRAGGVAARGAGRGAQHQGPALLNRARCLRAQLQVQVGVVRNAPAGAPLS